MGCCGGKEDTEKENERKLLEAAAEKERLQKQKQLDGPLVAANNRPSGTHRDRIIALFAKYEKENLPLIDPWMEKLAGPRRAEYFIKEFCLKRDCSEPKSKQEAMQECLTKHFAEKEETAATTSASPSKAESNSAESKKDSSDKPPSAAVLKKVEETMKLYAKITPTQEGKFFEGIFGPGDKKRMEEEHNDGDLVPSSSFAAGEALKQTAQEILDRIAFEEAEEEVKNKKQIKKKEKRPCTCDEELKERIMAMMIDHCPERLDSLVEEEHYYDSEAGAELLYSLIEEFGEEPESKQAAVTACYRRLLQEHDPQRLKSLPTMVAAAMAAASIKVKQAKQKSGNSQSQNEDGEEIELNGVQQAVAQVLKTYGVARPTKTANEQHAGGLGGASLSKQTNNSSNSAPAFIVPSHSSTSSYYDAESSNSNFGNNSSNNYLLPVARRFPPQEMRGHHFVAPYMTSMDGEVQKSFSAVPVPNHHKLISNYEKARLLLETLPPQQQHQQQQRNNNYDSHATDFSSNNSNNNNNKKSAVEELLDDLMSHDQENKNTNERSQQNTSASSSNNNSSLVHLQELEEKLYKDDVNRSKVKKNLENNSTSSDDSGNDHDGEQDTDVNVDGNNNSNINTTTLKKRKNIFNPEVETVRHRRNIILHDDVIRPAEPPLMHRRDGSNETDQRKPVVKQNPFSQNDNNNNVAATSKSTVAAADNREPVVLSSVVVAAASDDDDEGQVKKNNDNSLEGTPQKQVPNYANADEIDFDL